MATGDVVYDATLSTGPYALAKDAGNVRRVEVLGSDVNGITVVATFASSPVSGQNRIFDSAKNYKVTITEV